MVEKDGHIEIDAKKTSDFDSFVVYVDGNKLKNVVYASTSRALVRTRTSSYRSDDKEHRGKVEVLYTVTGKVWRSD